MMLYTWLKKTTTKENKMSRIILLMIGFVAGWFLKDTDWQGWLDSLKTAQQPPQKPISLLTGEAAEFAAPEREDEVPADELEKLTGIGPASNEKLNEHGIYTFAQVASISPEKLKEIVGARVKVEEVIKQAKALAN